MCIYMYEVSVGGPLLGMLSGCVVGVHCWGAIACVLSSVVGGEGSVEGSSPFVTCLLFEVVARHFDRGPLSPPALPDGAALGASL